MAGLYVHFPFCASRCVYCDFYARTGKDWRPYTEALLKEIYSRKDELNGVPPKTLYFGGGTPSFLPEEALSKVHAAICDAFGTKTFDEFTVEVNPDDITARKAEELRRLGAGRISMGVQSFCDSHLKWMGRRHSSDEACAAFLTLRDAGFDNLSLDLIFGFRGLSSEDWEHSISKAMELRPEHISCYQMSGRWSEADEDMCRGQYSLLQERLRKKGYIQYELSNYSLPGRESRHNSSYWAREPYLGFGAGAHSFDGCRRRSWNIPDIESYISGTGGGSETLSACEVLEEKIMLSLRTRSGLKFSGLDESEKAAIDKKALEKLSRAGKLLLESDCARIPEDMLFVSDAIIRELFPAQHIPFALKKA